MSILGIIHIFAQDFQHLTNMNFSRYRILALSALAMCCVANSWAADTLKKGDVNASGKADEADVLVLANHITGVTPIEGEAKLNAADVNSDGKIDVADIIALCKAIQPVTIPIGEGEGTHEAEAPARRDSEEE